MQVDAERSHQLMLASQFPEKSPSMIQSWVKLLTEHIKLTFQRTMTLLRNTLLSTGSTGGETTLNINHTLTLDSKTESLPFIQKVCPITESKRTLVGHHGILETPEVLQFARKTPGHTAIRVARDSAPAEDATALLAMMTYISLDN